MPTPNLQYEILQLCAGLALEEFLEQNPNARITARVVSQISERAARLVIDKITAVNSEIPLSEYTLIRIGCDAIVATQAHFGDLPEWRKTVTRKETT